MGEQPMQQKPNNGGPRPAEAGPTALSWIPPILFSMKFAIWIAVILAIASVAGVLVQEFFPVRDAQQAKVLSQKLPAFAYQLFMLLELQDPFRAVWFRVLLGLLAVSLLLCSMKRFGPNFRQAFKIDPIREPRTILRLGNSATIHHTTPELFETVVGWLKRRVYIGSLQKDPEEKVAALHRDGVSRTGPVLLHIGILVLVLGGLASSIVGKRSFLLGSPGQTLPIEGSRYALRVDDFQIEQNERGQVKQYRSVLTVIEDGREIKQQEISVNHPLRFAGYNVYQSSYQADPTRASSLDLFVRPSSPETQAAEDPHGHASSPPPSGDSAGSGLQAKMGESYAVPLFPDYELRVLRFFAHLKITSEGPINASREFVNPAVELEISHQGEKVATQWAFVRFPAHSSTKLPFVAELRNAQPVMATGLELNTNPGAPLIWLGIILSTLGLILSFLMQHRTIYLIAKPSERGWTLWMAGRSEREQIAFAGEFERLVQRTYNEARRLRRLEKGRQQEPAARDVASADETAEVETTAAIKRR